MTIRVYENLQDLTSIGEEWLTDGAGNTRAVFIDGNLRCEESGVIDTNEITKTVLL